MSLASLKILSLGEKKDIELSEEQGWLMKPEINYSKQAFFKLVLQVSGCDTSI